MTDLIRLIDDIRGLPARASSSAAHAERDAFIAECVEALSTGQPVAVVVEGYDAHSANAAQMFKVPVSEVTKAQRRYAKLQAHAAAYNSHALIPTEYVGEMRCADRLLNATHRAPPWVP